MKRRQQVARIINEVAKNHGRVRGFPEAAAKVLNEQGILTQQGKPWGGPRVSSFMSNYRKTLGMDPIRSSKPRRVVKAPKKVKPASDDSLDLITMVLASDLDEATKLRLVRTLVG